MIWSKKSLTCPSNLPKYQNSVMKIYIYIYIYIYRLSDLLGNKRTLLIILTQVTLKFYNEIYNPVIMYLNQRFYITSVSIAGQLNFFQQEQCSQFI